MGKVSSNAGKHPYLRPGFWKKPKNQFWEKSEVYAKEMYREIFNKLNKNERPKS